MKTNLHKKIYSKKGITFLFSLYLITFPFGANLLPISLGFMTIFPNLIILLFLFSIGVINYKLINKKIERLFLLFLLFWVIFSVSFYFFIPGKTDAIIDIRSVGVMFLTSYVLIWLKYKLGFEKWREIIVFSLKIIGLVFIFFGIIELQTGLHFKGEFTNKISELPISGLTYSPVFLFDNPNNFITYLLLCSSLIVLLDKNSKKNKIIIFLLFFIKFFFSQITQARIGIFASLFSLIIFGLYFLLNFLKQFSTITFYKKLIIFSLFLSFLIVFLSKEKYYGPIWGNSIMVNAGFNDYNIDLNKIPKHQSDKILGEEYSMRYSDINNFHPDTLEKYYNSSKIRAALIFNGIHFVTESDFLGIGPGQYRYRHKTHQIKVYSKTNISPHFWLIEIISQYGILIFLPYVSFLIWIFIIGLKNMRKDLFLGLTIINSLIIFGLSSLLPSSFLILDINWIFVSILIAFTAECVKYSEKRKIYE